MKYSPFHEGEIAVQRRAGEFETAQRNGVMLKETIPGGAGSFVRQQTMAALGIQDAQGRFWASVLFGKPGFLEPAGDLRSIRMLLPFTARQHSDPFWSNAAETRRFGMLIIDLGTRRRLRINGRVASVSADELVLDIDEAYPNCPKLVSCK